MNEKLNEVLEQIDDTYLEEAAKNKTRKSFYWFGAVAAILVIAILAGIFGNLSRIPDSTEPPILQEQTKPTGESTDPIEPTQAPTVPPTTDPTQPPTVPPVTDPPETQPPTMPTEADPPEFDSGNPSIGLLAAPRYPKMEKYPQGDNGSYNAWWESQKEQYDQPRGYADSLDRFFADSIALFLQGEGNQVYSPVNVYMALAMLAECADGTSRQQILDLFGASSIEYLRQQAKYVWDAHYCDDGLTTLLLANSVWLNDAYGYDQETVELLAGYYRASSYQGDLGSEEMNRRLRDWLNANTGELLEEYVQEIELNPDTAFALASTVYFSAQWQGAFLESKTADAVFHNPSGDILHPFMNGVMSSGTYYWGEDYGAVALEMKGSNTMWLILPDEDSSIDNVLASGEFLTMLQNRNTWEEKGYYDIHLSVPKFDVSQQTDLVQDMEKLGLTDIFDRTTANLTGLVTAADDNAFVSEINHAARVAIDEEGCIAAAYTVIEAPGGTEPRDYEDIDFVLDRPFIFVITSRDGLPLFAGTVTEP